MAFKISCCCYAIRKNTSLFTSNSLPRLYLCEQDSLVIRRLVLILISFKTLNLFPLLGVRVIRSARGDILATTLGVRMLWALMQDFADTHADAIIDPNQNNSH